MYHMEYFSTKRFLFLVSSNKCNEELTKISSMLKDTQNQLDCISKQIEALNKLKTATKSKSTKSDKPDAKKKAPLL